MNYHHEDQWEMPCVCTGCRCTVELNDFMERPGSSSGELSLCSTCHARELMEQEEMDGVSIEDEDGRS